MSRVAICMSQSKCLSFCQRLAHFSRRRGISCRRWFTVTSAFLVVTTPFSRHHPPLSHHNQSHHQPPTTKRNNPSTPPLHPTPPPLHKIPVHYHEVEQPNKVPFSQFVLYVYKIIAYHPDSYIPSYSRISRFRRGSASRNGTPLWSGFEMIISTMGKGGVKGAMENGFLAYRGVLKWSLWWNS